MVAISDTLNYLVLVGEVDILPRLYTSTRIPEQVLAELERPAAPVAVREWIKQRPQWLIVDASVVRSDAEDLLRLGAGERSAIALAAARIPDVILLIDEIRGRNAATIRRIPPLPRTGSRTCLRRWSVCNRPISTFPPTDRPIARE